MHSPRPAARVARESIPSPGAVVNERAVEGEAVRDVVVVEIHDVAAERLMARDFIVREEGPIPQERKAVGRAVVAELHDVGGDFAGRVVPVVKLEGVVDLPAILGEVVEIADKVLGEFVGQFDVAATGDAAEPAKDGGGTGQAAVTERETRLEPVAALVDVAVTRAVLALRSTSIL